MKCSESLSKGVSNVIRRYIDHMKFAARMAFSFIVFLHVLFVLYHHCVYGCMFCILFLFCKLCIFIVIFTYTYYYVCSVLYILF